ncbi:hypothetical protein D3C83_289170 [compost metagenome]
MLQRIQKTDVAEIERVVVGQADEANLAGAEDLDGRRCGLEVEHLPAPSSTLVARGDG